MKRLVRNAAVAAWLLCGVLPLYVLTRAQDPGGRGAAGASNVNGNMNGNVNAGVQMNGNMGPASGAGGHTNVNVRVGVVDVGGAEGAADSAAEGDAQPLGLSGEWAEVGPTWASAMRSPLVLRAGPGANAQVSARLKVEEGEGVQILEAAGDRLRVRVDPNPELGETRRRAREGWVEWGAVEPPSEAVVVDAASGEIVRRVPLEGGLMSVLFEPGGETVLFHGEAAAAVYEAGAADFKPRRKLPADGAMAVGELFFQPSTGRLVVPAWKPGEVEAGGYTLDFVRPGEGAAGVVPSGLAAPNGGRFLVSEDGRTGFSIQTGAAAWGGENRVSVAVFDLHTLTQVRGFALPEHVTPDDDVILARGGSELLVLTAQTPQRLLVVESQGGSVVRELPVSLGEGGTASLRRGGPAGAPPMMSYSVFQPDDTSETRWARLTPEGKAVRLPKGVALVAEAGGARYGLDLAGTRLFVLDGEGRVRASRAIRPRGGKPPAPQPAEGGRVVHALYVTPDGKSLVFIKGFEECGC